MSVYQSGGSRTNVSAIGRSFAASWLAMGRVLLFAFSLIGIGVMPSYAESPTININTASADALATGLNGVGVAKAYRIVEYREAHGPFEAIEELGEVKGIGQALIERNRNVIVLQ